MTTGELIQKLSELPANLQVEMLFPDEDTPDGGFTPGYEAEICNVTQIDDRVVLS